MELAPNVGWQDALHDTLRLQAQAFSAAWISGRTPDMRRNVLPADLAESLHLADRQFAILVERVQDDDFRSTIKDAVKQAGSMLVADGPAEAERLQTNAGTNAVKISRRSGPSDVPTIEQPGHRMKLTMTNSPSC